MTHQIEASIKRIIVALGSSRQEHKVLEPALRLAAQRGVELQALLVQDSNLLHLAGLPFASEVYRVSAATRRLDPQRLSQQFQRQTEQLQQALARSAQQRAVQTSVQVLRGQFASTVLATALSTDIVFLNATMQAHEGLRAFPQSRIISRPKPICAVFDGTAAAVRVLRLAAELSTLNKSDLLLLLPAATAQKAALLRQQVSGQIGNDYGNIHNVQDVVVPQIDLSVFLSAIRRYGCSGLVLERTSPLLDSTTAERLLASIDGPVVFIH